MIDSDFRAFVRGQRVTSMVFIDDEIEDVDVGR